MAAAPESADSSKGGSLIGWIDQRFPLTKLVERARRRVLRAEEFQLLVLLRLSRIVDPREPAGDGNFPDDELQAVLRRGVLVGRIHHAGRRLGLADPLHALDRCVGVFHRDLSAYVPRLAVRLAPQAARTGLDLRLPDFPAADGGRVHGLRAALGQYELLGRAGHRVPVRQPALCRRLPGRVDPRRLLHRGRHLEPILRAARGGAAAGADFPGRSRTSWRCTRSAPTIPTASTSRSTRTRRGTPSTAFPSIPTTR